ncbi:MAG: protein kinase, partial [Myxococcota bacterium]
MLKPGDILDHYIVEAIVGGGGMARVYRVRHRILDQTMALKVLEPEFVGKERIRKRFLSEGRIMAQVRHPAIVMVTDAVVDPVRGVAGLVMEYVEGPDLQRVISRMKSPPAARFVRRIFLPVLDAVHHVHHEGVVHRDLKPANVLLSRDASGHWYPRVTDFGVAWMGTAASLRAGRPPTRDGGLIGTPAYMSPEQARGTSKPDPRWDVWALGTVLYELATGGTHPFETGDEESTLEAVRKGEYVPPEVVHPGMDPRIIAAINGALNPNINKRLPSTLAMVDLLATEDGAPHTGPIQVPGHEVEDAAGAWLETADGRQRLVLGTDFQVGSGSRVDLHIPGDGVEPEHCRISHVNGQWLVADLSVAGTRVNGARVSNAQLGDGDQIRMGKSEWRFRIGEPAAASAPPAESLPMFGTPT